MDLDRVSKAVDIALKAEVHAFAMLGLGLVALLKGHGTEANLIIGASLAVFKGNR